MLNRMMDDKNETVVQARLAMDRATEKLKNIESIDIDKDYYHEDKTVRLTIEIEYRTDAKEEVDELEKKGINKEQIEDSMRRALNQYFGTNGQ